MSTSLFTPPRSFPLTSTALRRPTPQDSTLIDYPLLSKWSQHNGPPSVVNIVLSLTRILTPEILTKQILVKRFVFASTLSSIPLDILTLPINTPVPDQFVSQESLALYTTPIPNSTEVDSDAALLAIQLTYLEPKGISILGISFAQVSGDASTHENLVNAISCTYHDLPFESPKYSLDVDNRSRSLTTTAASASTTTSIATSTTLTTTPITENDPILSCGPQNLVHRSQLAAIDGANHPGPTERI